MYTMVEPPFHGLLLSHPPFSWSSSHPSDSVRCTFMNTIVEPPFHGLLLSHPLFCGHLLTLQTLYTAHSWTLLWNHLEFLWTPSIPFPFSWPSSHPSDSRHCTFIYVHMGVPWWKLLSFIDSLPHKVSSPFCGHLLPLQSPYAVRTHTCTCTCAHTPCRFYGLPQSVHPPPLFWQSSPSTVSIHCTCRFTCTHECRVVENWLPYSGKFLRSPIFADDRQTVKIKPLK